MNTLNEIFDRKVIETNIKDILSNFDEKCNEVVFKKGIYLYGSPGSGKTHFISQILKEVGYDMIKYDAGDIRNKALIETISSNNVSSRNVLDMMTKKQRKIAIVMDEIDGMNSGDKGGINALIKLIRQKKTKKQKLEGKTMNPIICIGNYYTDKKMRELMKVCNVFELKSPTNQQINTLLRMEVPNYIDIKKDDLQYIINYIQGDLRKLIFSLKVLRPENKKDIDNQDFIHIFQTKNYNEDSKETTNYLLENTCNIETHNSLLNETDRTIIALLWHENVIDKLEQIPKHIAIPIYLQILNNICFSDYIDRITFQNQIWQFNEMSSMIKTFYNNKIYHEKTSEYKLKPLSEIRFTKVLTKYSTEYNNSLFIQELSQNLEMDKKDTIALFHEIRLCIGKDFCNDNEILNQISTLFDQYKINKLDIKRFYRYLDKSVKKDLVTEDDDI
jgi:SpoVK/Ycf46/Vps4 family AAA+-type ATPase